MIRCGCPGSVAGSVCQNEEISPSNKFSATPRFLSACKQLPIWSYQSVVPYRPTNQPLKYTPDCLPYKKKAFRCKNDAECAQPVNQLAANRLSPPKWCSEEYLLLRESDCLFDCVAVSPACFYQYPNCRESACPIPASSSFPYPPFRKQQSHSHLFSTREQVYKEFVADRYSRNVPTIYRLPRQLLYPIGSYRQSNRLAVR